MRILFFDAHEAIATALEEAGHEVIRKDLPGGIFHVPSFLGAEKLTPDLLVQQEHLGRRTYLSGLENLPFPTAFWAIDTHLNLYWQKFYALLFDVTLTPHPGLFETLPQKLRPARLLRFAQPGVDLAWRPHQRRTYQTGFCGRIDGNRHSRALMVDLLQKNIGLEFRNGLSFRDMIDFYMDCRNVPNESIARETNFRLMEGASAGCLVISQNIADQNELFTPEAEILIYENGLELLEHLTWAEKNSEAAEGMGRRAWLRVQNEHLPSHRAAFLLNFCTNKRSKQRLQKNAARLAYWLALAMQINAGNLKLDPVEHARLGLELAEEASRHGEDAPPRYFLEEVQVQCILLLAAQADYKNKAARLADELLVKAEAQPPDTARHGTSPAAGRSMGSLRLFATASVLALSMGDFRKARAFFSHYHAAVPQPLPRTPFDLCVSWAKEMQSKGCLVQTGFPYTPETKLPSCSYEFLEYARFIDPERKEIHKLFARLFKELPSHSLQLLAALAECSLHAQDDWRLQMEFGLVSLENNRVAEGLEELREARNKAAADNRLPLFLKILTKADPKGLVRFD